MISYVVLWMLIASPEPQWHRMKNFATMEECEAQVVYLAQSLMNSTFKCLPSDKRPVVNNKVMPRGVGALSREAP